MIQEQRVIFTDSGKAEDIEIKDILILNNGQRIARRL